MASPITGKTKLLQPFMADPDHYWSVLNTYYRLTKRYETLAKWTEKEFDSSVGHILSERLGDQLSGQPLCVLGVGSAEGYQEMLQLQKLKNKFSLISATVIEPNAQKISDYQEKVQEKGSDFTGIEYEWRNQTFQQYVRSTGATKKYHFITIVHTMYFLGEAEAAVTHLYEMLEPGGILFIIHQREHPGKIPVSFPDQHTVVLTPRTATDESLVRHPRGMTSSEDIITVLRKNHIAFTQSNYTETTDVTACFTRHDTKEADLLMDFITCVTNFKDCIPNEIFNKVMGLLKSNARVEKSNDGDDRFYLDIMIDNLVVSK